ncbi:MAG TPA: glycosyltransferase family 4 protein [Tepidisphaeraceae bacterium]|jgi:glycosyltransferase involved in cell wall biosynthesis|nr:glycosyltransferase family 4 protein [Tepidisphaeraceae bacterium]
MKITFVIPRADTSGGVRVVSIYAKRLADRGHEVVVVSRPHRRPTLRERLRTKLTGKPLPYDARPAPSILDGLGLDHRPIDRFRPISAGDVPDADVVVATWWETAEWVAKYPPSKGAKAYFIQHYEAHGGIPADRVDATWRLPMHKIVIADWLAKMSASRFGDANYSLVPNSVETAQFFAPPRDKRPTPTVGMMYSHVPFKGCDIALKAFALACRNVPGLKLTAFGNRAPTAELPLPGGAEFVCQPPQDRIREVYAKADAWLFASRSEGFGLPILEAMACRTPVIAVPAGAAPELLQGGGGILTAADDPAAMALAIEKICRMDQAAWKAMSQKAFDTAAGYSWDDATTLFESALARAREAPSGRQEKFVEHPDAQTPT